MASKLAGVTVRQPAAPQDTSCVDESPAPSVGARAAAEMGENDERETWRATARDWYATLVYLVKTKPYMSSQSFVKPPLNPYITVMLTFITTIFNPAIFPLWNTLFHGAHLPICLEQHFADLEDLTRVKAPKKQHYLGRVKSSQKIGHFGVWNGPASAFMNAASGHRRTKDLWVRLCTVRCM